jgi:hypothetical protein
MTELDRVLSFPVGRIGRIGRIGRVGRGSRAELVAWALRLEEEVARLRREAVAELQRGDEPGARRKAIQLLKDAARLDTRARLLRAGES